MECLWFWPKQEAEGVEPLVKAHNHFFDEVIAFFGSNPDDPQDLCGEIELCIENEKYIMTKSYMVLGPSSIK